MRSCKPDHLTLPIIFCIIRLGQWHFFRRITTTATSATLLLPFPTKNNVCIGTNGTSCELSLYHLSILLFVVVVVIIIDPKGYGPGASTYFNLLWFLGESFSEHIRHGLDSRTHLPNRLQYVLHAFKCNIIHRRRQLYRPAYLISVRQVLDRCDGVPVERYNINEVLPYLRTQVAQLIAPTLGLIAQPNALDDILHAVTQYVLGAGQRAPYGAELLARPLEEVDDPLYDLSHSLGELLDER
mmetsp:Transcript_4764/g.9352  ORF Transcript_4764/g.9352 Transcript_4764/m.9352 type:complete len:241 (-) Transcript_4764:839-1561(-)